MPQVFLSTRRGAWILNRVGKHGYPIDLLLSSRIMYYLSRICGPSLKNNYMEKQMNQRFDHEMFGLKPKHRYVSRIGVGREMVKVQRQGRLTWAHSSPAFTQAFRTAIDSEIPFPTCCSVGFSLIPLTVTILS